jgi:hypothetical protein
MFFTIHGMGQRNGQSSIWLGMSLGASIFPQVTSPCPLILTSLAEFAM